MMRTLLAFLFLLSLIAPCPAQESLLEKAHNGQLVLPAGTLYVPNGLEWSQTESSNGLLFLGARDKEPVLLVSYSNANQELLGGKALEFFKEEATEVLKLESASLTQLDARTAPYPWPETQELRLKAPPIEFPLTVYVGSGSGKTLVICALGREAESTANRVAASFKENFEAKRQSQARQGSSDRIHGMLGTGTIFFLLFASLLPIGLAFFVNRRRKERNNPYHYAFYGLAAGVVLSLIFNMVILSRFSWSEFSDYLQILGGTLMRGLFVAVILTFFSKRWNPNVDDD